MEQGEKVHEIVISARRKDEVEFEIKMREKMIASAEAKIAELLKRIENHKTWLLNLKASLDNYSPMGEE